MEKSHAGLDGIVVGETKLSMVDGLKGELVYCGYNIDELSNCSYEEICCLFLNGDLPTKAQLIEVDGQLKKARVLPDRVLKFIIESPPSDHPMAVLRTAVSMLSAHMPNIDSHEPTTMRKNAIAVVAQMGAICAAICNVRSNNRVTKIDNSLSYAESFLHEATGERANDIVAKTMDLSLVLHADHGFNASTFVARSVTSSMSDMLSAVSAAIGSLKGPLHGGANAEVMKMLIEIGSVENVESWLDKALQEKRKIMGFGHRVYKVIDPRAKHLKRMSKMWGERVGQPKWFAMSDKLEHLISERKGLNPNVDFYSASTYFAMGIKPELYTLLFAMARSIGWVAHVMEQIPGNRIYRPEADYIGPMGKKYKPIEER